jgi:hypothetical protein
MIKLKIILFCCVILVSCGKKEENLAPVLGFVSISPQNAKENDDAVEIVIEYRDENGDLGENNPDIDNLFVKNLQTNVVSKYRIPQLAPNGSDIIIAGKFNIQLGTLAITNGTNTQNFTFEIYATDRANLKSNTLITPAVKVIK